MGDGDDSAAFQSDRGVTAYECSWNGCIPVTVNARTAADAARIFARDAEARGHGPIDPGDVEVDPA